MLQSGPVMAAGGCGDSESLPGQIHSRLTTLFLLGSRAASLYVWAGVFAHYVYHRHGSWV